MSAMAVAALGKMVGQAEKGTLIYVMWNLSLLWVRSILKSFDLWLRSSSVEREHPQRLTGDRSVIPQNGQDETTAFIATADDLEAIARSPTRYQGTRPGSNRTASPLGY
jgi:hypothetical protein